MSSVGAVIMQYHTKLKYVTDVPLIYTMGFMAIDKKAFDKISAADQAIVREAMSGLYDRYDRLNLEDDREAKDALFNAGLKRIVPAPEELAEIRAVLHKSNRDMAERGIVSLELYEEMMGYVDERRTESEATTGPKRFYGDDDARNAGDSGDSAHAGVSGELGEAVRLAAAKTENSN
jgi:hypothetical protein